MTINQLGAILTFAIVGVVIACSGGGTTITCTPGQTVACVGGGGCSGTAQCNASGSPEPCECPADDGGLDASGDADNDGSKTDASKPDAGPSLAGIGDLCNGNAECASNFCASKTNAAWCTKLCDTNADCAGSGQGGRNARGRNNYCIPNGGGTRYCFPGCALGQGDCDYFPGTTCIAAVDLNNSNIYLCSK